MRELAMKFEDLKFDGEGSGSIQAWADCGKYEVSVVQSSVSYGGDRGLYEIGVFSKQTERMCDPLGWGDEVKGWLKPEDVEHYCNLISQK